jgi:hypothetical protein
VAETSFEIIDLTDDQKAWIIEAAKRLPFAAEVVRVTFDFCEGNQVLTEGLLVSCAAHGTHPFAIIAWCHGRR